MNKRELAKNFDISLTTIDKWLLKGCPYTKKNRQYEFNLPDVIAWHKQYFLSNNNQSSDYQQSKAKKEHYRAELMRLEYEKAEGLLVETEKLRQKLAEMAVILKDALLLWVKRLPPEFGLSAEDQRRISLILKKEIYQILTTFSKGAESLRNYIGENKGNEKNIKKEAAGASAKEDSKRY